MRGKMSGTGRPNWIQPSKHFMALKGVGEGEGEGVGEGWGRGWGRGGGGGVGEVGGRSGGGSAVVTHSNLVLCQFC